MSPFLIILAVAIATFVLLLTFGGRQSRAAEIVAAGMASINIAGVVGLGWFTAGILNYDGVMVIELSICAGLMALLLLITGGGFALKRRGRTAAALAVLAAGALPTLLVYGFLLYLDNNPIDWR